VMTRHASCDLYAHMTTLRTAMAGPPTAHGRAGRAEPASPATNRRRFLVLLATGGLTVDGGAGTD
jgi:hypothetical protein